MRRAEGFALLEALVALGVALLIVGVALTTAITGRSLYGQDRARTALNQDLRNALDFVGNEVRQAGERLDRDPGGLEVIDGGPGRSDEVVVRRNLADEVLTVCDTLRAGSAERTITVARRDASGECGLDGGDLDGDGRLDAVEAWEDRRTNGGSNPDGALRAFVYDPVTRAGEFFTYEGAGNDTRSLRRAPGRWANTYDAADRLRVYLIEERRFRLSAGGVLELVENGAAQAQSIVADVTDFQARVLVRSAATGALESLDAFGADRDWRDVAGVEIRVRGRVVERGRGIERELNARFFPRNALSR